MTGPPSRPVHGPRDEPRQTVHIVIHSLWIKVAIVARLCVCWDTVGQTSTQRWSALSARGSGVLVSSPFRSETALPEANSFLSECQPFCNIDRASLSRRWMAVAVVVKVKCSVGGGPGLTERNLLSTLEQSPERGDTAATQRAGDRAG